MPKVIRRRKLRRGDLIALSDEQLRHLRRAGRCWPFEGFRNLDEMQAAWELHHRSILPQWVGRIQQRPFAWWLLEAIPRWGEARNDYLLPPAGPYREAWLIAGRIAYALLPPAQEGEAEYLQRHKLLQAAERNALGVIVPAVEQFRHQYPPGWQQVIHQTERGNGMNRLLHGSDVCSAARLVQQDDSPRRYGKAGRAGAG